MSNENMSEPSEPIAGPEPMPAEEGRSILNGVLSAVALTVSGIVAVALFATPTRLAGASRSARLKWQQRDREIHEGIPSAAPVENNNANPTPSPACQENVSESK